jgi:gluconate transporter
MIDLASLAVSIAIIILLIVWAKLNPAVSLIIGTLVLGFATGIPIGDLAGETTSGFGNLMTGIGLSVGFGIILGQLLSDSGGAQVIANTIVRLTTERFAILGIGIAAFLLSVPVFYDVTFVILVPLAIPMARAAKKPISLAIGAIAMGAGIAHTMIPPTPNPLAAAEIFGFNVGLMMLVGSVVGFIALLTGLFIYNGLLPRIWNNEKDVETEVSLGVSHDENKNAPSFFAALMPIVIPILMILMGTGWEMFNDNTPAWLGFIGDKNVALLVGALLAYLVASKNMSRSEMDESANTAIGGAGLVLFVTGAGGAFGAVIKTAGIDKTIADFVVSSGGNFIVALLLCFVVGAAFRVATGSGTVASITTMTIMAAVAPAIGIHPVWVAMACLSGALCLGHVNDSGFWISAKIPGFSLSGAFKTYTLAQTIAGCLALLVTLVGATIVSG